MNEESIFLKAITKPPAERQAFLSAVCGDNLELQRQVEALLRAHVTHNDLLESTAVELIGDTSVPPDIKVDTVIGPYQLVREIGAGGMGVVYLAEQREPVARQVAVKVIKPGLDTREVIARFNAERQALAMMDHPHISKVLDAGATESGRPFFVMEMVKGVPITRFCDENNLDVKHRLELVIAICHAVQHAHQKAVIHRDLKPSNVLVNVRDGKPFPMIIDFGVAKALDPNLGPTTLCTRVGQLVGTLEYMSPEQSQFNRLDVDTRTDIYSLGVLLYELLTGTPPHAPARINALPFDEALRAIREHEPVKPSVAARLAVSVDNPNPRRFGGKRQFGAELDWIVLKAMDKDRSRRYGSASALADDLQRFLNNESVAACPPSLAYRMRKFLSRNYQAITIACLLIGVLCGGVIGTTLGFLRARSTEAQMRGLLGRMQDQTLEELKLVPQSHAVQLELSQEVWTVFEGLLQRRPQDAQLRYETAIAAERLGIVHKRSGDFRSADTFFGKAIDLLHALPQSALDEMALFSLCECYQLRGIVRQRLLDLRARSDCNRALELIRDLYRAHPDRASYGYHFLLSQELAGHINWLHGKQGIETTDDIVHLQKTLPTLPAESLSQSWPVLEAGGEGSWSVKTQAILLTGTDPNAQERDSEEEWLRTQIAWSADHPSVDAAERLRHDRMTAVMTWRLASILTSQARWQEAEKCLLDTIAINQQWSYFNEDRGRKLGWFYRELSNVYLGMERYDQAEQALLQSLEFARTVPVQFGRQPLETATVHKRLGTLLHFLGRSAEAKEHFQAALEIYNPFVGECAVYPFDTRHLVSFLATCPDEQFRDPQRAVRLATEAIRRAPDFGRLWHLLGVAHFSAQQYEDSVKALQKSLELQNGGSGITMFNYLFLALASWHLEQHSDALLAYQAATDRIAQGEQRSGDFSPLDLRRFLEQAKRLWEDDHAPVSRTAYD